MSSENHGFAIPSIEVAVEVASGQPDIARYIMARLRGEDTRTYLAPLGEEGEEDIITSMLLAGEAITNRPAIIEAMQNELERVVFPPSRWNDRSANDVKVAGRIAAVLNLAKPPELRPAALGWLGNARGMEPTGVEESAGKMIVAAVEAASPYARTPGDVRAWRDIAEKHPRASAMAFGAMLKAGATQREASETLAAIEKHAKEDGWPVAVDALRARIRNTYKPKPLAPRKPRASTRRAAVP